MTQDEDPTSQNEQIIDSEKGEIETKIPWHFWLFVALAGTYLGFRLIEFSILGFKAVF